MIEFAFLRQRGIELMQQLSGETYTDYNLHDPGVTILEALCYALTDLSYRTGFPIADLLADKDGKIPLQENAFFLPEDVLTCNPVTVNDFRKFILDKTPSLHNAWLEPFMSGFSHGTMHGLYTMKIQVKKEFAQQVQQGDNKWVNDLKQQVRACFTSGRNLCEDLVRDITVLQPVSIKISASVVIAGDQPELLLANIYRDLEAAINPPVKYYTAQELLEKGHRVEDLYTGPLLKKGFIPDETLPPRRRTIDPAELMKVISMVPGVSYVRELSIIRPDGSVTDRAPFVLEEGTCPYFEQGLNASPIHLLRGKYEVRIRSTVFNDLWPRVDEAAKRSLEPVGDPYFSAGVLRGQYRDIGVYRSIQLLFPVVYGIGIHGLGADPPPQRVAAARQLKAYLLFFEQVLADYLSQLSNLSGFFSFGGAGTTSPRGPLPGQPPAPASTTSLPGPSLGQSTGPGSAISLTTVAPSDTAISSATVTPSDATISSDTVTPSDTAISSDTVTPSDTTVSSATVTPSDTTISSGTVTPSDTTISSATVTPSDTTISSDTVTPSDTAISSDTVTPSDTTISSTTVTPSDTTISSTTVTPSDTTVSSATVTPSDTARTYYHQPLYDVPGIRHLLRAFTGQADPEDDTAWNAFIADNNNAYIRSLKEGSETQASYCERKNAVLDHLLARFNVQPSAYPVRASALFYGLPPDQNAQDEVLEWKAGLLRNMVSLGYNRVRGGDYLQREHDDKGGFYALMAALLYIRPRPDNNSPSDAAHPVSLSGAPRPASLSDAARPVSFSGSPRPASLSGSPSPTSLSGVVLQELALSPADAGKNTMTSPPADEQQHKQEWATVADAATMRQLVPLRHAAVPTHSDTSQFSHRKMSFFLHGLNAGNYTIGPDVRGGKGWLILYKEPDDDSWQIISRHQDEAGAAASLKKLVDRLRRISSLSEGFYVVEHVLLRPPVNADVFGYRFRTAKNEILLQHTRWTSFMQREHMLEDILQAAGIAPVCATPDASITEWGVKNLGGRCRLQLQRHKELGFLSDPIDLEKWIWDEAAPDFEKVRQQLLRFRENKLRFYPRFEMLVKGKDDNMIREEFYNFNMTIVLPAWPARFQDANFQAFAMDLFRMHTPAHIRIYFQWLNISHMREFEGLYPNWIRALQRDDLEQRKHWSDDIAHFLKKGVY